jgi:hypothetical protein
VSSKNNKNPTMAEEASAEFMKCGSHMEGFSLSKMLANLGFKTEPYDDSCVGKAKFLAHNVGSFAFYAGGFIILPLEFMMFEIVCEYFTGGFAMSKLCGETAGLLAEDFISNNKV